MSSATLAPTSDETLKTILRIDAILSAAGVVVGALAVGRLTGNLPGTLAGAWTGFLAANVAVWGTISLVGVRDLLTGRMTLTLEELPAETDGQTIEVTRQKALATFVRQGPPLDDTLGTEPAAAETNKKKELELVA